MVDELSALHKFLQNNNIPNVPSLPLVHTTTAYAMQKILKSKSITPVECDVFKGENLTYFFCGRPSYKKRFIDDFSKIWQLPSCIIMNWDNIVPKRIFPFDSGAFKNNLMPDFLSMMNLEEFNLGDSALNVERVIGAFFVSPARYFKMQPRSGEDFDRTFELTVLDAEIQALRDLSAVMTNKVDDRRFAIEIQTSTEVNLDSSNVMAVVCPEEYLDSEIYCRYIDELGATPLPYSTFPLRQEIYYYTIYNHVFEFFKSKGLIS